MIGGRGGRTAINGRSPSSDRAKTVELGGRGADPSAVKGGSHVGVGGTRVGIIPPICFRPEPTVVNP